MHPSKYILLSKYNIVYLFSGLKESTQRAWLKWNTIKMFGSKQSDRYVVKIFAC